MSDYAVPLVSPLEKLYLWLHESIYEPIWKFKLLKWII